MRISKWPKKCGTSLRINPNEEEIVILILKTYTTEVRCIYRD